MGDILMVSERVYFVGLLFCFIYNNYCHLFVHECVCEIVTLTERCLLFGACLEYMVTVFATLSLLIASSLVSEVGHVELGLC